MQLNYLPFLRTDETLYSVAARTRLVNAARNDRDACRSLFGPSSNMRVSEFPVNVVHFCSVTGNLFGDTPRVLEELTVAGFFKRVGSAPWNIGSSKPRLATAGLGLSMLSNGGIKRWLACAKCMESDLITYANSYWRRSHQLPGAFLCVEHNLPLSISVAPAKERHIRFVFPEDTALKPALDGIDFSSHRETLFRLSKLAKEILDRSDWQIEFDASQRGIQWALRNNEILAPSGFMDFQRFAGEFFKRYGFLNRNPDFADLISANGIDILGRSLRRPGAWRHPFHSLLIVDWLFGSWASYYNLCHWYTVMHNEVLPEQSRRMGDQFDVNFAGDALVQFRQICLDALESSPTMSRSTFARISPKAFRWLTRYDSNWFRRTFPRQCRAVQRTLF